MPSQSPAQHRLMEAIAHGFKPTGRAKSIPVSVAQEFADADKATGKYSRLAKAMSGKG